jgi:hypothetical protein
MRQTGRRLLVTALATATLACGLTTVFNLIVDPYGSYRIFEFAKDTPRPAIYRRVKLAKAYDIRRIKPQAIVLGTSRSHIALRMTHEGWRAPIEARYNAAFDGATTKEMYAYLLHAQAINPLQQVVLGLDFWHLSQGAAATRSDFRANLLFEPHHPFHNAEVYAADLALLSSLDTTTASINQLRSLAGEKGSEWLASDGQRIGPTFFREVESTFSRSPGAYFRDTDRQEIGFMVESDQGPRAPTKYRSDNSPTTLTSLDYISKIVNFCREEHIDLRIFITPSHAHHLEIISELGGWPALEQGKRDLVQLLTDDAARHPGARQFPLFDFSEYSSVTTENVPRDTTTDEMEFYWDSSHFKERVGDWILDRLFEVDRKSDPAPPDFGVLLTAENVNNQLEQIRINQKIYRRDYPEETAFLKALIQVKAQPRQYVNAE